MFVCMARRQFVEGHVFAGACVAARQVPRLIRVRDEAGKKEVGTRTVRSTGVQRERGGRDERYTVEIVGGLAESEYQ